MRPLFNPAKYYSWASPTALYPYLTFNPEERAPAEIWIGAHAKASSWLNAEYSETLFDAIQRNPSAWLGDAVQNRFGGQLPFLVKFLGAGRPLSIQLHPGAAAAEQGFSLENSEELSLNHPHRSYVDPYPKPELLYALTQFKALCGWASPEHIASRVEALSQLNSDLKQYVSFSEPIAAFSLMETWLQLSKADQKKLIDGVGKLSLRCRREPYWHAISKLYRSYPEDMGVAVGVLLNLIEVAPGEAFFIPPGTPHSYLEGTGLEIMGNSDNVLRIGLTEKYCNEAEFLRQVDRRYQSFSAYQLKPVMHGQHEARYQVPTKYFGFACIGGASLRLKLEIEPPAILVGLKGSVSVISGEVKYRLLPGAAVFLSPADQKIGLVGEDVKLGYIYTPLSAIGKREVYD